MIKIFENENINLVNEFLENVSEDSKVIFKGSFYGLLNLKNKNNINLELIGENANFYGTKVVNINCFKYSQNIYYFKLDKNLNIERVWIDDEKYILARFPNVDVDCISQVYCSFDEVKNKILNCKNKNNIYIRGLHEHGWGGNAYKVFEKDKKLAYEWIENNNRSSKLNKDKLILENVFEELDYKNEFYYDDETEFLYFYNECDDLENKTLKLEYAINQNILNIENSNANIVIKDIKFSKTDRSMFKSPWHRYLRSDWAYNYSSCVLVNNSNNVKFDNCEFTDLGNTALLIKSNCKNIDVKNCIFNNCASNGVLILGDENSTYCTSSWKNDNHKTKMEDESFKGAKNDNYPKDIVINNCLFEFLGLEDLQCAGVCISLSHNVTVSSSTFRHLPRAGINIAENAFGGHKIISNDLYDCVKETGDHGPFNSWGRDRFWSLKKFETTGKYGKKKKEFAFYDMIDRNLISSNRVIGSRGFGIDLDDGSSGYDIEKNLCIGVGIKLREGFNRTVQNNVIINAPFDYHCAFYKNDDIIKNNIVCNDLSIRCVLENKGSNAKFINNYFVDENAKDSNRFIANNTYTKEEIFSGNYSFNGIEPLNNSYGKKDLEDVKINLLNENKASKIVKSIFYTFSTVDEGIKTATGSKDYSGLFVSKISPFTKLYKLGVKKGDLICKINDVTINSNNFKDLIKNAKDIEIIRNQKSLNIKTK